MNRVTSTGYEPDFDIDLKRGQDGEQFVANILTGDRATVEVKRDFGTHRTGNLYVETHQLSRDGKTWIPSGIATSKADWWVYCGPTLDGFLLVKRTVLADLARVAPSASQPIRDNKTNASHGRLVKLTDVAQTIMKGQS